MARLQKRTRSVRRGEPVCVRVRLRRNLIEICSKMATLIQHGGEEGVVGGFDLAVQNRPGLDNDCCSSNGARVPLETEVESVRSSLGGEVTHGRVVCV